MKKLKINKPAFFIGAALAFLIGVPLFVSAEEGANTPWTKRAEEVKKRQEERAAKIEERQEERQSNMEERKEEMEKKFCERFVETASKVSSRLEERGGKIQERVENREGRMESNRGERDGKLDGKRDEQDTRRAELYKKLEERADTDAEKAAVVAFKEAMEKAVDARRDAVDAAISTFRSGVDAAVTSRKDSMGDAYTDFKAEVDAALAKAKSDCEGGADAKSVRDTFKAAMEDAREGLKSDRTDMEKVGEKVRALAQTRQDAFAKALADFKAAAEKARADLKAVLGDNETTEGSGE